MKTNRFQVAPATRRLVAEVYRRLDYGALGPVYCYEGGEEFWRAKRGLCQRLAVVCMLARGSPSFLR
jgi:hypothetical protein